MNTASLAPARMHPIRFGQGQPSPVPPDSDGPAEATAPHAAQPPTSASTGDSFGAPSKQDTAQSVNRPATTTQSKGFLSSLGDRITRFFKDLRKAFTRLFSSNKPKSEFDAQFKTLKRNLRQTLNEEVLHKDLKAMGEKLESEESGSEVAQAFEPLITAAKTKAGRQAWINEHLTKGLETWSETVSSPEKQSEFRQSVLTLPVIQKHVLSQFSSMMPGLVPQSRQGSSPDLHPEA